MVMMRILRWWREYAPARLRQQRVFGLAHTVLPVCSLTSRLRYVHFNELKRVLKFILLLVGFWYGLDYVTIIGCSGHITFVCHAVYTRCRTCISTHTDSTLLAETPGFVLTLLSGRETGCTNTPHQLLHSPPGPWFQRVLLWWCKSQQALTAMPGHTCLHGGALQVVLVAWLMSGRLKLNTPLSLK